MKRILSIILTTVLLLGVLAACGTTPAETTPTPTTPAPTTPAPTPSLSATAKYEKPNDYPLTETLKAEIEAAWADDRDGAVLRWYDETLIHTRHYGLRYYGMIGDYVILYDPTEPYQDGVFAYGGEEFFLVYPSSTFTAFDTYLNTYHEEFEAAILAREDLDDPRYYGGTHPSLGESPYTVEQLNSWGIRPKDSWNCENGYLGTYNGYSAYAIYGQLGPYEIKIGGVCFWWGTDGIALCKDGEVHMLDEAFDLGILNNEDLRAIAYYWYGETLPEL